MTQFAKVKENPDLVRDMNTQAILNTNVDALKAYKKRRQKEKDISDSMNDINTMKQDINDLKTLMQRILDKIG
jgi:predicted adenine nucleotide alpha hydrolase (AANH) superfamily ATPase